MRPHTHATRAATGLFAFALIAGLIGCSGDKAAKELAEKNQSNIQRLSNLYAAYQNGKGNKGPKDEADFKKFITEYAPDRLQQMGVTASNLDAVFASERDGEKFHIRYNVAGGRGSEDPVVFEKTGKDGKKQVGITGGKVLDVDDGEYKELLAGRRLEAPRAPATSGEPAKGGRPGSGAPPGAPKGPPG